MNAVVPPSRHPSGLRTLFFTEMWERFSFYGMRALLVLFLVDAVGHGGLGMDDKLANAIYGLYTAAVYLAALPGGWVADRFLGAQRCVWWGGVLIVAGQFTLALSRGAGFFLGLALVVAGTGLLKPNVSTIVGNLYPAGDGRRDAGFSIFYMGINLGAFLGPLAAGYLARQYGWHVGFAAAGVGMVIGLTQFQLTRKHLGAAGRDRGHPGTIPRRDWLTLLVGGGLAALLAGLIGSGTIAVNPLRLAQGTAYVIGGVAAAYFAAAFLFFGLDAGEKKRVGVILVLFIASAMFWSGFEQAGSSFNLFAQRYTERVWLGFEVPASWFQSLGPMFIITLAPVMAAVWLALGRRGREPSLPMKFAWGLLLLGVGFGVMAVASWLVAAGQRVWPTWLLATYFLHSVAELCVSPVGLSSVTKLAPARLVGQMMGVWFLATSLGNLIAGLIAGEFNAEAVQEMPGRYLQIVLTTMGTGLLLLLFVRPLRRLTASVG